MKRIGEMLIEAKLLTKSDLDRALARQREMQDKRPVGEILVEMKIITLDTLVQYLDMQLRQKFNN
ncbi:MAG: hypothetical protein AABZ39_07735 [Spirochaetota bacterium]